MKSTSTNVTYADQPTTSRNTDLIEDGTPNFGYVCHSIKDSDITEESLENLNGRQTDDGEDFSEQISQLKRIIINDNKLGNENQRNTKNQIELADIPA